MVAAGMTPAQVLVAATRNAAELANLGDVGTVAARKSADFLVLDANPLENIANTRKILAVIRNGKYLARPTLDAMLGKAKSVSAAVSP